jgi:TP901 family phage tail tape measure protein
MARQSKGITLPIVYKADLGGLKAAEGGLANFGKMAGRVALGIGAAFAGIVVGGVKMAIDLETTFSKIEGLVGVTGDELDELRDAAKRLGPEFGKSAGEAADALFFITSAGLRGSAAINVLEASLKGSAIGLGDTKVIADLATSAVNAYGEANLDGATAVDVLAEAVRLGKLEPAELAGSMGQVLPIASAMGVSFEEVGAVMAAMSRTGTDASQASTQLRGIMTALLKPTTGAERALRNMGLSSAGLRESIRERGLLRTLEDLTTAFEGNDEGAESVFGNVRALSGVLDLFGENSETTIEILEQMTDGLGILDEAFAVTEDTVGFKAAKAFEMFKSIMLEIGDAVLPLVVDLLETMLPHVEKAVDAVKAFVDTRLGPFIDGLRNNPEFQTFLETITQLFFDVVPQIADFAVEVGILAGNLMTLLKPALDGLISEGGPLDSMLSILSDINFFLNELNSIEIPAFDSNLKELLTPIGNLLPPMFNMAGVLQRIASGLRDVRKAWEELKKSGFNWNATAVQIATGRKSPSGGGRATGGSVMGGTSYMVGERGPEMFVPRMSGSIVPNHRLGGGGGNITINVNAGVGTNGPEVGRAIVAEIKKYERSSGRVFVSA